MHQWEVVGSGQSSVVYRCAGEECRVCPPGFVVRLDISAEAKQRRYFSYYTEVMRPLLCSFGASPVTLPPIEVIKTEADHVAIRLPDVFHVHKEPTFTAHRAHSAQAIDRSFPPRLSAPVALEWKLKGCVMPDFVGLEDFSKINIARVLFCRFCMQHAEETLMGIPFCPCGLFRVEGKNAMVAFAQLVCRSLRKRTEGQHKAPIRIHASNTCVLEILHAIPHIWKKIQQSGVLQALRAVQACSLMHVFDLMKFSAPKEDSLSSRLRRNSLPLQCQSHILARQPLKAWQEAAQQIIQQHSVASSTNARCSDSQISLMRETDTFYIARSAQDCSITILVDQNSSMAVYPALTGVHLIDLDTKEGKGLEHFAVKERKIIQRFCDLHNNLY